ncbi:MAG: pirin family protein [Labilithrix sp.]|nr:pirin family protein [Labilithrix sp.]
MPANEPECVDAESASIELLVDARPRDLGGFSVRRVLPSVRRRLVGPFIFFDHMGPAEIAPGVGFDVRPHPHIGLATITYLFDGAIDHRDTLGSMQAIRPGDVNWMIAGRGIAHSERSSPEARRDGIRIHGIQSWVALPVEQEETEPRFEHHPSSTIPRIARDGAVLDVIAGTAYGERSPVSVLSPTLYVHGSLEAGARVAIDDEHEQRAIYVVEGSVGCDERSFRAGTLIVLRPGAKVSIASSEATRVMIIGGAKLEGTRNVWWNFVSSSAERIERAKDDWRNQRFGKIPGDDLEFIPLPER